MPIPVVLCGGSGSRLWPLSRQQYPKQFYPLVEQTYSVFQQTLLRFSGQASSLIIITNFEQRFLVKDQLQAVTGFDHSVLYLEPFGRNTAPAAALAAFDVHSRQLDDDVLIILPADHHIVNRQGFDRSIQQAVALAREGMMVTLGVTATSPETGYGYIKTGRSINHAAYRVAEFVEKPNQLLAKEYLHSGNYYWNSGIFVVKASVYLAELEKHAHDIYQASQRASLAQKKDGVFRHIDAEIFAQCPDDSIDYAVMEKTNNAAMIVLDSPWSDLGTWASLWEISEKDDNNNAISGDVVLQNTKDCYVNASQRLVALVDVDGLVVVETADAVLVADKDNPQGIKKVVSQLKENNNSSTLHHREVHRPWGSYQTVDEGENFQVKRIQVKPGHSLSLQKHLHRAEHWVVVKGIAEVICGDKQFMLNENESTFIPLGEIHRLSNPSDEHLLEIIEVQSGSYLGEDDIERFDDNYGRH